MKTIILPNGMELPDGLEVPDSIDPDATKWLDENSEESPSQPLITGETPNSGISVTPNEAANEKPRNGQFNDQFDALGRPMLSQTPTPVYKKPAVDASGMPLPRRVDEIDQNATRVIPIQREVTPVSKPARSSQNSVISQMKTTSPAQKSARAASNSRSIPPSRIIFPLAALSRR